MGNDVDDGRERSRSWRATQRQSSGRRRDLLRAELKGEESASHAQGYAHAMEDGGTNRRGVEWRRGRGPLRSAKIAKFMKECGKNSKSEEALRRRRVNPLIEEDSAKLRRRILLLLMPFIPRRDGAGRWNGGMREVGWEKEGTGHSHGQRSEEGGRKEGSPEITLPRCRSATGRGRSSVL